MDTTFRTEVNNYGKGKYEIIFSPVNPKKGRLKWCLISLPVWIYVIRECSLNDYQALWVLVISIITLALTRSEHEQIIIDANRLIEKSINEINALANEETTLDTWSFDEIHPGHARQTKHLFHVCRIDQGFPAQSVLGTNDLDEAFKYSRDFEKHGFTTEIRRFVRTTSPDEIDLIDCKLESKR